MDNILYISSNYFNDLVGHGYVNALQSLGKKVFQAFPHTTREIINLIEDYDTKLIMTESRYGTRHLPIDVINKNNVSVVLRYNRWTCDPYDFEVMSKINHNLVYIENIESGNMIMIPPACDITKELPNSFKLINDLSIFIDENDSRVKYWVKHISERMEFLGKKVIISDVKTLSHIEFASLCANSLVSLCPTAQQQIYDGFVGYFNFAISAAGGLQVFDCNKNLFDCPVFEANNLTEFFKIVDDTISLINCRREHILLDVEYMACHNSYFNRLKTIFTELCDESMLEKIELTHNRLKNKYVWDVEARLENMEEEYAELPK